MTRARGNKSSKATVRLRQEKEIDLSAENLTQAQIAAELGVHRTTVLRNLRPLDDDWRSANVEALHDVRDKQLTRIAQKWEEIESDEEMTGAEKHLAWSRWMKLEIDLRGTNAPTQSITAHVATNTAIQYRFLEHSHGLEADQIEEVFAFMDRLPRTKVTIDMSGFGQAALAEGETDE